ncbi:MAG: nicotinate (nicotinamide) nucleotide adenylyltransferase [Bacteroidales bacterium]
MANKKVALYFGSFNPVHNGHLAIANHIIEKNIANELWFVLTPLNPFKEGQKLWDDNIRLLILNKSIGDKDVFTISTIEFDLPKPNYTIRTLQELDKQFSDKQFSLVIGSDNWISFDKWKDYQAIIDNYDIFIYPRSGYDLNPQNLPETVQLLEAPIIDISSTQIRSMLSNKDAIALNYLSSNVKDLIEEMFLNPSSL